MLGETVTWGCVCTTVQVMGAESTEHLILLETVVRGGFREEAIAGLRFKD